MTEKEMAEKEMAEKYLEELRQKKIPFDVYEVNNQLKIAFIAGLNKANEWHYIKNGDYPKDNETVLALCIVGGKPFPYLAQYWKDSTNAKKNGVDLNWSCWLNNLQREVVEPYAWREITIPELGLQMPMQEG